MRISFDDDVAVRERKPRLADPTPPAPPAKVLPTAAPRVHHVVRWFHDGRVIKTAHETKERAIEYAETSHYATIYKYCVMDGREIVVRRLVSEPTGG